MALPEGRPAAPSEIEELSIVIAPEIYTRVNALIAKYLHNKCSRVPLDEFWQCFTQPTNNNTVDKVISDYRTIGWKIFRDVQKTGLNEETEYYEFFKS